MPALIRRCAGPCCCHAGRRRTTLNVRRPSSTGPSRSGSLGPHRGLPPPRPRDYRLGKLAGAHVHVAREPVDELGFGFIVVPDEVEQRVAHRHAVLAQLGDPAPGPGRYVTAPPPAAQTSVTLRGGYRQRVTSTRFAAH
jgi:hypothetical protein